MKRVYLFALLLVYVTSYLGSTKNCPVNDPEIKRQAAKLKGKTKTQTAENIFNFVKYKVKYEGYSNTKKGAVRTLREHGGNCCDQAHLLVALWRASGIDALYAHGTNHWWGQCIIDGKKCDCDPTNSSKHKFCKPDHPAKHRHPTYHKELDH